MRAVAAGKGDALPETVLAILHARLMRLQPEARRILRIASVFGEICWAGGVRRLLGRERSGEQFESWLKILVEAEILGRRKESRFAGEVEYFFCHGLLREAAYCTLPEDERRLGHYLVGCYLEELGESDPTILAEHFQRSGELERALGLYTRAAEEAERAVKEQEQLSQLVALRTRETPNPAPSDPYLARVEQCSGTAVKRRYSSN